IFASDNKTLGRFVLADIPPAPRGIPQIEVTFDIDSNGIMNVTAKDRATNKSQKIQITATTNLSKDDVDKMVKDADSYASEDKKRREAVEAKNRADSLIYTAEKTIRESGDKADGAVKKKVEDGIVSLKSAAESGDINKIKSESDTLTQNLYELTSSVYAKAGTPPGGAPHGEAPHGEAPHGGDGHAGETKGDENIVDAEYKVQDENK
ncbi:MAG: Hsp70 family protein, partial [Firmicutes bacterium]|nr:Hsp70 family protein [Bacillota bacterium]